MKVALCVLVGVLSVAVPAGPALANLPGGGGVGHTPAQCLTGAVGPYTLVGQWKAAANGKTISLYCGDPTKGVLHIDESHPVVENITGTPTDAYFLACLYYVFHFGRVIGTGNTAGSHVYSMEYSNSINSDQARAVVRDSDGYILTAWPNTYVGDFNWYACAVAPDHHRAP